MSTENAPETSAEWSAQLETLRALAQVVTDENLSEIEFEQNGVLITLKAQSAAPSATNVIYAPMPGFAGDLGGDFASVEYSMDAADAAKFVDSTTVGETKVSSGTAIVSPMVGLFYRAPSPNDANFVEVGDRIEIGQTVGLVETMKVFNEITSEIEGTVLEIKAVTAALVETGDVLMTIG